MPSLFFPAQTVDSQRQGLLEEVRSGHGHVQRLGDPRYSGTVRWGLPPGGRRRRLGLGAAPHRMPLPAVQVLWEPLLCGGLHPGETGISEGDRPRLRTHRLPLVGTLRIIFRKQVNHATNRPLPGKPRQRFFCIQKQAEPSPRLFLPVCPCAPDFSPDWRNDPFQASKAKFGLCKTRLEKSHFAPQKEARKTSRRKGRRRVPAPTLNYSARQSRSQSHFPRVLIWENLRCWFWGLGA